MPYCRNCGQDVGAGDRFCQHCGAQLGGDSGRGDDTARDSDGAVRHGRDDGPGDRGQTDGRDGRQGQMGGRGQTSDYSRAGGHGDVGHGDAGHGDAGPVDDRRPQDRKDGVDFAFSYPLSAGWGPVLVSGLLLVGSFLILPFLALVGYSYRVGRAAALGYDEAPGYESWGKLIVDGLRVAAVGLVLAVGFGVAFALVAFLGEQNELFALLIIPLYLGVVYVGPAFVLAFIGTDSVPGAFTSGRVTALLGSGYYAKSVLFAFLLQMALGFLVGLLFITIIGWIWGYAFVLLAQNAFWGYVHYQAAEKGIVPLAQGTLGAETAGQGADASAHGQPR